MLFNTLNLAFSLKLSFLYALSRLKSIHAFLPKNLKNQLPVGWNSKMFWTAFRSGGKRVYFDYYSKLQDPKDYSPKTSVSPEFQLSEKDIKFFHENGYFGPFDVISPSEAEELRQYLLNSVLTTKSSLAAEGYEFDRNDNDAGGLLPKTGYQVTEEREKYQIKKFNTTVDRHLDDPKLLELFKNKAITERCAQLIGANLILWRSAFFQVYPHSRGTQLHQSSYRLDQNMRESVVKPPSKDQIYQLTCWIALTEANENNGAMIVIPGTHKEIYPLKLEGKTQDGYEVIGGNNYFAELDYPVNSVGKKLIKVKAGQCFLFSERVIHGSADNKTYSSRWAVNCRIATTDTQIYTEEMLEKGHQNLNFNIKNISLKNWKAVLVRGEDHFGYNRLLK